MSGKTEKLEKEKKQEKTYSAEVVRNHISMYSDMVYLTDHWHISLSAEVGKRFKDTIKKVEEEFLNEFKDKGFYYYLDKMKKTLKS